MHKNRQSIWKETIATGVVCLFLVNTTFQGISYATPAYQHLATNSIMDNIGDKAKEYEQAVIEMFEELVRLSNEDPKRRPDNEIEAAHDAYREGYLDYLPHKYIGYMTREAVKGSKLAEKYKDEFNEKTQGILAMAKGPEEPDEPGAEGAKKELKWPDWFTTEQKSTLERFLGTFYDEKEKRSTQKAFLEALTYYHQDRYVFGRPYIGRYGLGQLLTGLNRMQDEELEETAIIVSGLPSYAERLRTIRAIAEADTPEKRQAAMRRMQKEKDRWEILPIEYVDNVGRKGTLKSIFPREVLSNEELYEEITNFVERLFDEGFAAESLRVFIRPPVAIGKPSYASLVFKQRDKDTGEIYRSSFPEYFFWNDKVRGIIYILVESGFQQLDLEAIETAQQFNNEELEDDTKYDLEYLKPFLEQPESDWLEDLPRNVATMFCFLRQVYGDKKRFERAFGPGIELTAYLRVVGQPKDRSLRNYIEELLKRKKAGDVLLETFVEILFRDREGQTLGRLIWNRARVEFEPAHSQTALAKVPYTPDGRLDIEIDLSALNPPKEFARITAGEARLIQFSEFYDSDASSSDLLEILNPYGLGWLYLSTGNLKKFLDEKGSLDEEGIRKCFTNLWYIGLLRAAEASGDLIGMDIGLRNKYNAPLQRLRRRLVEYSKRVKSTPGSGRTKQREKQGGSISSAQPTQLAQADYYAQLEPGSLERKAVDAVVVGVQDFLTPETAKTLSNLLAATVLYTRSKKRIGIPQKEAKNRIIDLLCAAPLHKSEQDAIGLAAACVGQLESHLGPLLMAKSPDEPAEPSPDAEESRKKAIAYIGDELDKLLTEIISIRQLSGVWDLSSERTEEWIAILRRDLWNNNESGQYSAALEVANRISLAWKNALQPIKEDLDADVLDRQKSAREKFERLFDEKIIKEFENLAGGWARLVRLDLAIGILLTLTKKRLIQAEELMDYYVSAWPMDQRLVRLYRSSTNAFNEITHSYLSYLLRQGLTEHQVKTIEDSIDGWVKEIQGVKDEIPKFRQLNPIKSRLISDDGILSRAQRNLELLKEVFESRIQEKGDGSIFAAQLAQTMESINDEHMTKRAELISKAIANGREIIIPQELIPEKYWKKLDQLKAKLADDIKIVPMDEAKRLATNRKDGPKRIIILTPDMEKEVGPNCEAKKIILGKDKRLNFLYLEGSVALARSINAEDRTSIALFYNLLTKQEADRKVMGAIDAGRLELPLPAIEIPTREDYERLEEKAFEYLEKWA